MISRGDALRLAALTPLALAPQLVPTVVAESARPAPAPVSAPSGPDTPATMMAMVVLRLLDQDELRHLLLKAAEVMDLRTAHGIPRDQHLEDAIAAGAIPDDEVFDALYGY